MHLNTPASHTEDLIDREDNESDRQFSEPVIDYQNQVETILACLFRKEEELHEKPAPETLQEESFYRILEEYSQQEKFISEFCEYCHTIMKCKEDGYRLCDDDTPLTDQDRDEIGIQMDAMMVRYEHLKLLSHDRLQKIQRILEHRQQTMIENFEEWLSKIELQFSSMSTMGPDYEAIQRQIREMEELGQELEQKQDFLNFMSKVIIFDEIDSESMRITKRSCESLDARLESMNRRWEEICQFVEDRNTKLRKAELTWRLLDNEGPKLAKWLKKIEMEMHELLEAAENLSLTRGDTTFQDSLIARANQIDADMKAGQSYSTLCVLENRVRKEIESFDDPCSMLVIELERKLEDIQDHWNRIMRGKRKFDSLIHSDNNITLDVDSVSPPTPLSDLMATQVSSSELSVEHQSQHEVEGVHNCRVEEWKHSLESFSNWLRGVETSLGIDGTTLSAVVGVPASQCWSQLDAHSQLLLLNDIEAQIVSSYQDEFDCLILQGQQIIEDLLPEIGENDVEANLKRILTDIEIRYGAVKRCLFEFKKQFANTDKWFNLLNRLRDSCDFIIQQMSRVIPENLIGVDLINLAQQQDQLIRAKMDLDDYQIVHTSMQEARLFLKICDSLQRHSTNTQTISSHLPPIEPQQIHKFHPITNLSNNDIWLSFRDLREDIETQLDRLTLHFSELSQLIEDRLTRLDEVHKEIHELQHAMQELAAQLQVAEILKSEWLPMDDLSIDQLSEQLDELKVYRERLSSIEQSHKLMNCICEWMTESDVPLSQQNLKRISELNTIFTLIEVQVQEREKLIDQALNHKNEPVEEEIEASPLHQATVTTKDPYIKSKISRLNWIWRKVSFRKFRKSGATH